MHFFSAVLIPFFTEWGKIEFGTIMLLQAWFMFCVFILEIPTGALADYLGRKKTMGLAAILNAAAAITYVTSPTILVFVVAEFLFAAAVSLFSGAKEAFVYDTLKSIKKESQSKPIFGKMDSMHLLGMMVGATGGGLIASQFGITAPMLFTIIPIMIAFIISLTFTEPLLEKKQEVKNYLKIIQESVNYFRHHQALKQLTVNMIFIHVPCFLLIWMYQLLLQQLNVDIALFGFVHTALIVSQIAISSNFLTVEKILGGKKKTLFFMGIIPGIMFILLGTTNEFFIILPAMLLITGFGLTRRTLYTSYFNKHIPSDTRSTLLASVSMVLRFAMIIANIAIGFLVNYSLQVAFVVLGVLIVTFSLVHRVDEQHLID